MHGFNTVAGIFHIPTRFDMALNNSNRGFNSYVYSVTTAVPRAVLHISNRVINIVMHT